MPQQNHRIPQPESSHEARRPYEKPQWTRVELSLEETLASGCKQGDDFGCTGPPITMFDAGS